MKLKALSNLSKLISKYRPDQIHIVTSEGKDKANLLYSTLLDHPNLSDEEAMYLIYDKNTPLAFKKLKLRLKDKLFNTLFFIDLRGPKFSTSLKSVMACYRQMAIYFTLVRFQQTNLAIGIGEKLIKKARENDLSEVVYPVLMSLRLHFATVESNFKKYKYYQKLVDDEFKALQYKHKVEDLYSFIFGAYSQSRSSKKKELLGHLSSKMEELNFIQNNSDSFFLQRRCYLIKILFAQINGNASLALQHCNEALYYFQEKSQLKSKVTILNFIIQKLAVHVKIKNYDNGLLAYQHGIKFTDQFTYDWHVLNYYYFLLCLGNKHYEEAKEIYQMVTKDRRFKTATNFFKEMWSIFEAYIYIALFTSGRETEIPFSANKYINNIPTFSNDKKGNNVSILIAHFMLLCFQNNYDNAIDRVDGLKQYSHRYLREDETIRSNCFIKMLLSVAKAEFNPIRAKRYAEKFQKKLIDTPPQISEQSIDIEIIPYEDLWEMLLKFLNQKK